MVEIRVFKAEKNETNRSYYAVTGAKTEAEAIYRVIKMKKAKKQTFLDYNSYKGVIAPYVNDISKEEDRIIKYREDKNYAICVYYDDKIIANCVLDFHHQLRAELQERFLHLLLYAPSFHHILPE